MRWQPQDSGWSLVNSFYCVALKRNFRSKMKYGQQEYDFDEGVLAFISPNQVISVSVESDNDLHHSGLLLLIHPDILWNTPLAKRITQYDYFSYSLNEALHLSDKEEAMVAGFMHHIEQEYSNTLDKFSQDVIIAHVELLLTYAERFYERQFLTRKINNHTVLNRLEEFLATYFNDDDLAAKGLPTVQQISEALTISPNYLSRLLKTLTGQSTQQFIHDKLIGLAKEKLSITNLSVNEIAYSLGFEHAQSFSKLFKMKTKLTPLEFRQSFK